MLLRFLRLTALLCAVACVALGAQLPASAGEGSLVPEHPHWVRLPADTGGMPMVAVDSAAGTAYVLSGTGLTGWNRVQAVALPTGRPLSKLVPIPKMEAQAPLVVDEKRHLVMYEEALPTPVNGVVQPAAATIVGLGLRGGAVRELFRYQTRVPPTERLAGMTLDDSGDDLLVLSAMSGGAYSGGLPDGSPVVHADRLSIDALVRKGPATRWSSTYALPAGPCAALMFKAQPAGLLVVGSAMFFGCGVPYAFGLSASPSTTGQQPGLTALAGVTREASPAITATFYPAPGKIQPAESLADRHTRRLVLMTSTPEGNILRVFDTDHRRYVGTIRSPGENDGATTDPRTGRLYFAAAGQNDRRALGHADLAPLVPAQGETQADPWAGMLGQDRRRITFDTRSQRLLVPWHDTGAKPVYAVAMVRDELPRYVPVPHPDPDAGAVDTVDRPGLTDSNRSASARAVGADYQSIGGTANILVNAGGGDNALNVSQGSRYLRQAYVKEAALGSDGSTAGAVAGEEDGTTDGDRGGAGAGSSFAPAAECSDYGTSPKKQVAVTAQVACDLEKERTQASATYVAHDAVFITGAGAGIPVQGSPVPAPVQVGRSSSEVASQRDADRGALHTTVTATAENITVLGTVRIGKVTSTVTVSAHGRRGTALATAPKVDVSDVTVGTTPVCGDSCSLNQVSAALNKALAGRARVDFPQAEVMRSPGGTTAQVAQDAWYHAERVLDYDKGDDDFVVPAMTIIAYLDGKTKSRLVVDLAGVTASASYRTYRLDRFTGGPPAALAAGGAQAAPAIGAPAGLSPLLGAPAAPTPATAEAAAQQGLLAGVSDALHLALRSPRAAIPLLFIWALLGLPEYLAARRRLLLELPMLTRETDVA